MPEAPRDTSLDPVDGHAPRQEWEAPALTELGSFEELTQFFGGPGGDAEAFSSNTP